MSRSKTLRELLDRFLDEPRDQSQWSYVVDRALSQPRIAGDPGAIRRASSAFHSGATGADHVRSDLSKVAVGTLPEVWSGWAAADAATVAGVTASAAERSSVAFTRVSTTLDTLADDLEKAKAGYERGRWELNEAIRAAEYPDINRYEQVQTLIGEGLRGMLDAAMKAESAGDQAVVALGALAGQTRAGRMRNGALTAIDSLVLADANGRILTAAAAARADLALEAMSAADRARMDTLLSGCVSTQERAYLLKALANGHSIDDVVAFDNSIRAHATERSWLAEHLGTSSPGAFLLLNGNRIGQPDETTCGSTALMALRIDSDPIYALRLSVGEPPDETAGAVEQRMHIEAKNIHHETTSLAAGWWPEALGTPPGNMKDWANANVGFGGYQLEHNLVGAPDTAEMDAVVSSAQRGQPSILLIGDGPIPRHYVMVTGVSGDQVTVYDPSGGWLTTIPVADLRTGTVDALGFGHLFSVLRDHS